MSNDEYGSVARLYDPLLNPLLDGTRRLAARAVVAKAKDGPVLDLCCGTGRQAMFLRRSGLAVTGVDLSPAMLDQARKRTPEDIEYFQEDASATHFTDRSFGAVLISLALHEKPWGTALAILGEAMRLVAEGGPVLLLDYAATSALSARFTRPAVAFIERLAGREHHANYREFLSRGALPRLCSQAGLSHRTLRPLFFGNMELAVARQCG